MNRFHNYSDDMLEQAYQEAAGFLAEAEILDDEESLDSWADRIFLIEEEMERRGLR